MWLALSRRKKKYDFFRTGQVWLDTEGKHIQAHGGSVIYVDGIYYWYGENKEFTDGTNDIWTYGIRFYRSNDLYNWEDLGLVIPPDTEDEKSPLNPTNCMLDRPHIIYNKRTKKYVCWVKIMHKEGHQDETVLTADKITGSYTIVNQGIRPLGMSAGDFDLAVADSWHGPYRVLGNPHPEDASHTSFHSQISCIFKVEGTKDLYIAAADRWCPDCMDLDYEFYAKVYDKLFSGTEEEKSRIRQMPEFSRIDDMGRNTSIADYVWLPIRFVEACEEYPQGMVFIDWKDEWCWQDYVGR